MIASASTPRDFSIRDSSHYSEVFTLVGLLQSRAIEQPNARAYTFLIDGKEEGAHITYASLDRKARAIAVALERLGAAGERALLLYPPGIEFAAAFFGCLYAGVIAVPANPPQSNKQVPRLKAIISDAEAKYILTSAALLSRIERCFADTAYTEISKWVVTEDIDVNLGGEWCEPDIFGDALAYLQYTSGSTSTPKGVMVSHGNVLHNMACLDSSFHHPTGSSFVTWLPHFHDMGLIYGVLEPVFKGFPCYMMPSASLVQQPFLWLNAISRYKATHSVGPNFAYDHCTRKIRPEQIAELDLSSWNVAINGAEPVRKDTLERFIAMFEPCGFRRSTFCPGYGLAEASLMVTGTPRIDHPGYWHVHSSELEHGRILGGSVGDPGIQTFVSSGYPPLDTRVAIVDPDSRVECSPDRVGEVWVSSKSVTLGYWKRAEETEHTFRAFLEKTNEGPFLRTGDLGFLKDGQLYITGRIKDLIIIAGRNHYPQDIEQTVQESHAAIRLGCCAAFSLDIEGEERLVVAAEIDHRYKHAAGTKSREEHAEPGTPANPEESRRRPLLDAGAVVRAIRQAVATHHEVQAFGVLLLRAGTIPKTSSGKIQRHACSAGFQAGALELWEERSN